MYCQKCGTEIEADVKVCPDCGTLQGNAKLCRHCGEAIDGDCIICPKCGKQVQEIKSEQPQVVINNTNTNEVNATATVNAVLGMRMRNKWVALCLCIFLGFLGAHKFYEGKGGMGILYILTFGLFGIGLIVDFINILLKPNPYYV